MSNPELIHSYLEAKLARDSFQRMIEHTTPAQLEDLRRYMLDLGYVQEDFPKPSKNVVLMRRGQDDYTTFPNRADLVDIATGIRHVLAYLDARRQI